MSAAAHPTLVPLAERYPEMQRLALALADDVCRRINREAPAVETANALPYKQQCCLELLIAVLEARV